LIKKSQLHSNSIFSTIKLRKILYFKYLLKKYIVKYYLTYLRVLFSGS
jgi:hypothetical protein